MNLLEMLKEVMGNNLSTRQFKDKSEDQEENDILRCYRILAQYCPDEHTTRMLCNFESVSSKVNPHYEGVWHKIVTSNCNNYNREKTDKIRNYLAELYGGWLFNMEKVDKILYEKKEMFEMRKK